MNRNDSPIRFKPERYRMEAARVRREAETADLPSDARRRLIAISEQFIAVAEMLERDPSSSSAGA